MDGKVIIGHGSLRSTFGAKWSETCMISLTVVLFDCESDHCFLKLWTVLILSLSVNWVISLWRVHQENTKAFERLPSGKAKCKTCCKEISCTGGNTSGLLRHLEAYHPKLAKVGIDLILDLLLHSFRSWTLRSWNELFRDRKGNLNQEKEVRVRSPGRTFLVHKSTRWTNNCRRSSKRPW